MFVSSLHVSGFEETPLVESLVFSLFIGWHLSIIHECLRSGRAGGGTGVDGMVYMIRIRIMLTDAAFWILVVGINLA